MGKLTISFAITMVVAASMTVVLWQQLRAERIHSAQLQEHVTRLDQGQRSEPMPQVARNPAPEAPTNGGETAPVPPRPSQGSAAANSAAAPPAVLDLSRDSELCSARRAAIRAQLPLGYPDAAKVLGLSPSQSGALFDLLSKQQETIIDTNCGPEDARRRSTLSAMSLMQSQQAELQALLGPAKYQEFQEYLPTREVRGRLIGLSNMLSAGGTPLADQQAESLRAAVLAEEKGRREQMNSRPPPTNLRETLDFEDEKLRLLEESQDRILGSALSYLTPQQHTVVKSAMKQYLALQRAPLRARRAQFDARGNEER